MNMSQPGLSHFPETSHCSSGLGIFKERQRPIQAKYPAFGMDAWEDARRFWSALRAPVNSQDHHQPEGGSRVTHSAESSCLDGNSFKRNLEFTQEQLWICGREGRGR